MAAAQVIVRLDQGEDFSKEWRQMESRNCCEDMAASSIARRPLRGQDLPESGSCSVSPAASLAMLKATCSTEL